MGKLFNFIVNIVLHLMKVILNHRRRLQEMQAQQQREKETFRQEVTACCPIAAPSFTS